MFAVYWANLYALHGEHGLGQNDSGKRPTHPARRDGANNATSNKQKKTKLEVAPSTSATF